MQQTTEQKERTGKALLFAPLVLVPLILLMAWGLGVGKGTEQPKAQKQGLNTSVPEPQLPENPLDKLALYRKADKDSAQREKLMRANPLFNPQQGDEEGEQIPEWMEQYGSKRPIRTNPGGTDETERRVRDQLSRLEQQLAQSAESDLPRTSAVQPPATTVEEAELSALQEQIRQASATSTDSEITAINQMLKNVMDVQHPDLVRERMRSEAPQRTIYPVFTSSRKQWSSSLGVRSRNGDTIPALSAFNDLQSADTQAVAFSNAIRAEIFGTQQVLSGASVTLQLSQDIYVRGQRIVKGVLLSGMGRLTGDRYNVEITSITAGQMVIPVKLTVYDLRGLPGIHISHAISRDVATREATSTAQGMQFMSLDPSLQSQAIGAGIETAKGLFARKAKLIKSTLKNGHPVLLIDDSVR